MRVLAIDSATAACSVGLFDGDVLAAGFYEEIGPGHAERLVPLIADLPDGGRAERICVSLGPGSFTGVRVGVAAARALGLAWRAEVRGYPTLALVAAIARERAEGPVSVVMTGGHGEWFVQNYRNDGSPEDSVASLAPEYAVSSARHSHIAGSAADALVAMRGTGTASAILPDARRLPALSKDLLINELAPLYGREPDARMPGARQ